MGCNGCMDVLANCKYFTEHGFRFFVTELAGFSNTGFLKYRVFSRTIHILTRDNLFCVKRYLPKSRAPISHPLLYPLAKLNASL
jgi:hypothetical protein